MKSQSLLVLILVVVSLLTGGTARAQNPLPNHTASGILIDRVLPLAHLEDLDGSVEAPPVSLARWRQAVYELTRAAEAPLPWPQTRPLGKEATSREIPLAVLWAGFDRLVEAGKAERSEVFAFTVLRENSYYGQDQVFNLASALVLTHDTEPITGWHFDADDGLGWRDLVPGKDLLVSYSTTGFKTLRLLAELSDGRQVQGISLLNVKGLITPEPTATWSITASESYQDSTGTGLAYLYLADGHESLVNPVVIVEGFDLDNTMDWPALYDLLNQENLLEDLRADGFDAVVLNFTEAMNPIQRNAFVLTQLLTQVRANAGSETSLVLVGPSMGGLVSRYALLWLEDQGTNANIRTFISFDAPQKGANIPLGLQYWLSFFRDESTDADFLLSRLNTPAARQMLLYHYTDPPASAPGSDPLMAEFQADLTALGDWPVLPRLVGVANGSGLSSDQGYAAGDQLILYEYRSFLVDIDGNVWAVPDQGTQVVFDGMIDRAWPLEDSYQTVTVTGTLPWDNAPGGFRNSLAQMDTSEVTYGDIIALHDGHCFIPTISSLALDVTDPFFDIAGAADLLALSSFDAIYYPAANQEHVHISPETKTWLMEEIQAGPSAVGPVPQPGAAAIELYPAVPNPFNPVTKISFRMADEAPVVLQVHDLSGRVVRTLIAGEVRQAGRHQVIWRGIDDQGQTLASGVYLYSLQVGDQEMTNRMTLLK